jgi:hypothetical protein
MSKKTNFIKHTVYVIPLSHISIIHKTSFNNFKIVPARIKETNFVALHVSTACHFTHDSAPFHQSYATPHDNLLYVRILWIVGTSHMSDNRQVSIPMQRIVDFMSMGKSHRLLLNKFTCSCNNLVYKIYLKQRTCRPSWLHAITRKTVY